jgi:hypothetical protein
MILESPARMCTSEIDNWWTCPRNFRAVLHSIYIT